MATRREQCLPTWKAVTRVINLHTQLSEGKEDERARSLCCGTARSTDFSRSSWTRLSGWLCRSSCRAQIVVCCPVFVKQDHCYTQHKSTMQCHWLQQATARSAVVKTWTALSVSMNAREIGVRFQSVPKSFLRLINVLPLISSIKPTTCHHKVWRLKMYGPVSTFPYTFVWLAASSRTGMLRLNECLTK